MPKTFLKVSSQKHFMSQEKKEQNKEEKEEEKGKEEGKREEVRKGERQEGRENHVFNWISTSQVGLKESNYYRILQTQLWIAFPFFFFFCLLHIFKTSPQRLKSCHH